MNKQTTQQKDLQSSSNGCVWVDPFIGGCPYCGEHDEYLNIRRQHWFICRTHRVKWLRGENLFSSWRHESEQDWKANARELRGFKEVTPIYRAEHLAALHSQGPEDISDCERNRANHGRSNPSPAYVALPAVPETQSPVPWLSSIHAIEGRGPYGDAGYRGNCSGLLIRDLLLYYRPKRVLDPMAGSGTCADVCRELGIVCESFDLLSGMDATDAKSYAGLSPFDFVWLHPPYWKLIRYSDDPRCLSNAPTIEEFLKRLRHVFRHCVGVLNPEGHLAVLMGDGKHAGQYQALPFRCFQAAVEEGLWLAAPEIIRFSHGTSSASKRYSSSFIPRVHDVCLVLRRCRQQDRKPGRGTGPSQEGSRP